MGLSRLRQLRLFLAAPGGYLLVTYVPIRITPVASFCFVPRRASSFGRRCTLLVMVSAEAAAVQALVGTAIDFAMASKPATENMAGDMAGRAGHRQFHHG